LQQQTTHAVQSPHYERSLPNTLNPLALPFSPAQVDHSTKCGYLTISHEPSSKQASIPSTSQAIHSAEEQPIRPSPQVSRRTRSKTLDDGSQMPLTSTSPRNLQSIYNSRPTRSSTWPPQAGKSIYLPIPPNFSIGDKFNPRLSGPFREDTRQPSVALTMAMGPHTPTPLILRPHQFRCVDSIDC
jgi:hypothetical protein